MYQEFIGAGLKIFGLHPIRDGKCDCGSADCKAVGKHPIAGNWQHTPHWSEEQLQIMESSGQLDTGYGVLVEGLLVVDVDARNGGVESYERLQNEVPALAGAGLIVETGSGGGSKHLYFALTEERALVQHLHDYPGIDFKSTGYVVGPGSLHASGKEYSAVVGTPYDIAPAPDELLKLLDRPQKHRAHIESRPVDVSDSDLKDMLDAIPNTDTTDYEVFIRIGMALHEATKGSGYELWEYWSQKGAKHDPVDMPKKWHSFGKSGNPVTLATLVHYAKEAGWKEPVTFGPEEYEVDVPVSEDDDLLSEKGIDLLRPPGFVGEVTEWVNSQCLYPREHLAVMAALMAVSNVGGMRYRDPLDHVNFNLFCFGVADSSTGKEAVFQAHNELLRAAGVSAAIMGAIKSEQEIYRNLIRNQAAYYAIDELGEVLAKIMNAKNRGGTPYLEGVVGLLLSAYSKANSYLPINGDLKDAIRKDLASEISRLTKAIEENEDNSGALARRLERAQSSLDSINVGIEAPFLSIFGVTTPTVFDDLMNYEMAANGLMGRTLQFKELEGNPRIKPRNQREKPPIPERILSGLRNLYAPGYADIDESRVELVGDKADLQTNRDAGELLDVVYERFHEMAEQHLDATGLHTIPRRGYELVAKVSGVLAMAEGLRTVEHVRWAYALVRRDIELKLRLAYSNSAQSSGDALCSKILSLLSEDHGESARGIKRKCRSYTGEDVDKALELLEKKNAIELRVVKHDGPGRPAKKYFAMQ